MNLVHLAGEVVLDALYLMTKGGAVSTTAQRHSLKPPLRRTDCQVLSQALELVTDVSVVLFGRPLAFQKVEGLLENRKGTDVCWIGNLQMVARGQPLYATRVESVEPGLRTSVRRK